MNTSGFKLNIAVVIGINDYKNGIPTLGTARQDAEAIAKILKTDYQYQVHLITDTTATPATSNNLQRYLETELPEILKQENPSRLLFYFAGHGIIAFDADDNGPQGHLIPQDAKLGDVSTYLPMQMVEAAISKLSCRHCLVILDCCFAGAFRWSSTRKFHVIPAIIHQERYDRFIQDPAWQVITSAASDQYANDSLQLKDDRGIAKHDTNHSPFAAALMEALSGKADAYTASTNGKPSGDGVITATELYMYLRNAVEPATQEHSQRQTPGIWPLKNHDKGEYIFLVPGHPLNLPPAPPLDESKNPYRGLESFEEEHSAFFFGRTASIEKLHEFVSSHPLTVVLGASGSGKSSLVKAGLVPYLKQQLKVKSNPQWQILAPFRPGESPLKTLNNLLVREKLARASITQLDIAEKVASLSSHLAAWSQQHPNQIMLLVIDQFEELITFCKDEQERSQFLAVLAQAVAKYPQQLRLVLTLRSDFEPQFRDTVLQEYWQASRFVIAPMTRADLREAIEKPAEKQVMYFEPHELVEQLIDEVADMPGALPLLSFGLSELYLKYLKRQRDAQNRGITIDRALTQADYQELGGVIQSLTQRADEEYEVLVKENPAYAQIIRQVMLRMVAIGGGELARRQVPLSELEYPPEKNGLVKEVIERFTNVRLLVKGEDTEGNSYVEPAHDALVRGWQRLLTWKQEDEESLILQRRLTPAAEEWKSQERVKFLWNTNPRLDLLKNVLNSEVNWLNKVEAEFVQRSVGRKSFNTRRNWSMAIAVMLGLATGLVFSLIGQKNALVGQVRASRLSAEANLQSGQELDALVASLQAGKNLKDWPGYLYLFKPDNTVRDEVTQTLRKVFYQGRESNRINKNSGHIAVSTPDRKILTVLYEDFKKPFYHLLDSEGKKVTPFPGFQASLDITNHRPGIFYSRDGRFLATADITIDKKEPEYSSQLKNGNVILWDFYSQNLIKLPGHQDGVKSISFSPDGLKLASVDGKDVIRIWDLQSKKELTKLRNSSYKKILGVGFNPKSTLLIATVENDGNLNLWEEGNKESFHTFHGDEGSKNKFSKVLSTPDGKRLIIEYGLVPNYSTDEERGVQIFVWNYSSKSDSEDKSLLLRNLYALPMEKDDVSTTISLDGSQLIAALENTDARIWKLEDNSVEWKDISEEIQPISKIKLISISLSTDGKRLATADRDGSVKLFDLETKSLIPSNIPGNVKMVELSADGKNIAIVDRDNSVGIWNLESKKLTPFPENDSNKGSIVRIKFSPDNNTLAVEKLNLDESSKISLWNLEKKEVFEQLNINNDTSQEFIFSSKNELQLLAPGRDAVLGPYGDLTELTNKSHNKLVDFKSTQCKLKGRSVEVNISLIDTSDNSNSIASGDGNTVCLKDLQGNAILKSEFPSRKIDSISLSGDGSLIAVALDNGTVSLGKIGGLDELIAKGCDRVRDYLQNNPKVSDSDKHLCDVNGTSQVPKH